MPSTPASAPAGADPDRTRRVLAAWVAERADMLDAVEQAALDAEQPDWRAEAAQLIAEGLLAYVVLEMVAPDLAVARAQVDSTLAGRAHTDDAALTKRLTAHLQDFVDYRAELAERGGLLVSGPCEDGHDHHHQRHHEPPVRRTEDH